MLSIKNYIILVIGLLSLSNLEGRNYVIDNSAPYLIKQSYFDIIPTAGDTIFIDNTRTKGIIFENLTGKTDNPIIITNKGGQVNINDTLRVLALELRNGNHVKISGKGVSDIQYGFKLGAKSAGISLSRLSSNIEIENIEINHHGFFGIVAKEDYKGNPPYPIPVFKNLSIHDCYITNVTEGMYIGETKTPGMEFQNVDLYNNIVTNTGREGIQISNGTKAISVYNNLFYKNGTDSTYAHGNNLQIGDNTEAEVYNNIFYKAYQFGVIVLGKGNIHITDNYFEGNEGIFIDNRKVTDSLAPITVSHNYFKNLTDNQVIKNYNQENPIVISNNSYNDLFDFYETNVKSSLNTKLIDNTRTTVPELKFRGTKHGAFEQAVTNSDVYSQMGPYGSFSQLRNNTPQIVIDSSLYRINSSNKKIYFSVIDSDNDKVMTSLQNTPSFIELYSNEDGSGYNISINAEEAKSGKYNALIEADDGFGGITAKSVEIDINLSNTKENIAIYPNPCYDELTIKSLNDNLISYTIFNSKGVPVKNNVLSGSTKSRKLDTSSLTPETYIINIRTSTTTSSKLLIKR